MNTRPPSLHTHTEKYTHTYTTVTHTHTEARAHAHQPVSHQNTVITFSEKFSTHTDRHFPQSERCQFCLSNFCFSGSSNFIFSDSPLPVLTCHSTHEDQCKHDGLHIHHSEKERSTATGVTGWGTCTSEVISSSSGHWGRISDCCCCDWHSRALWIKQLAAKSSLAGLSRHVLIKWTLKDEAFFQQVKEIKLKLINAT